ncbi:glycosyltransferase family 4 protein [Qipengyuania marisflavi]|uniref:Glycosyltransferase family 1 protein n=1 Tax=Qipengyuania marisflavi TaxID=2486356 RepID=A0A5S3P7G0_9SPHN|nr:glycosyltransferase family 1 protein [Qipengyuania marisflavi]TMM49097.1 glycosyltransferase family 1 protein [Qipengyuania marisflavi]
MNVSDLRIALVSGNYNYTRDGANQALNCLMGYVMGKGAQVRVYSPTVPTPAFEPTGELVSLPSFPLPGRSEFQFPLGLPGRVRDDLEAFKPNVLHVASPDVSAHRAVSWARDNDVAALASVHTRFETYPRYYKMGFLEPAVEAILRRLYRRCDALVAPSPSMIETLREQEMHHDISLWSRGVDRNVFGPDKRDAAWRAELGLAPDEVAIGFLGRLVMEKGLDVFADTVVELRRRQVPHRVVVIGEGPARAWFEKALPGGIFVGFQSGPDLGRALASTDLFFNPSITETFGNVTLEAMASGLPVVAAGATGSTSLVLDGETGALVPTGSAEAYADVLERYCRDPQLRQAHGAAGEMRSREFSWDAINQAVVDVYLRLAKARANGDARS